MRLRDSWSEIDWFRVLRLFDDGGFILYEDCDYADRADEARLEGVSRAILPSAVLKGRVADQPRTLVDSR